MTVEGTPGRSPPSIAAAAFSRSSRVRPRAGELPLPVDVRARRDDDAHPAEDLARALRERRYPYANGLGPRAAEPPEAPGRVREHQRVRARQERTGGDGRPPTQLRHGVEDVVEVRGHQRGGHGLGALLEPIQQARRRLPVAVGHEPVDGVRGKDHGLAGSDSRDSAVDVTVHHGCRPSTARSLPARSRWTSTSWYPSARSAAAMSPARVS